ncbi:MAG: hypothetical protein N2170_02930 [Bacteroidia bacterium]|nr:hypothetical protein [Bacteroidia bacterium]
MATHLVTLIGILWGQIRETRSGQPTLITFPDFGTKRAVIWVAIAWPHAPHQRELGEFIGWMVTGRGYTTKNAYWPQSWASRLGATLATWSGPEGAAIFLTVPRSSLIEAVEGLYATLTHLPIGDPIAWEGYKRKYLRQWEGFSLEQELKWRLKGATKAPGGFTQEEAALYVQRYLQPDSLYLIIGGALSVREKIQLRKLTFRSPFSGGDRNSPPSPPPPSLSDTTEENLWAYPAYVALQLTTPPSWAEKIAFIEAFLTRWREEAAPLRWQGEFWGKHTYLLFARVDGKSYAFLRGLAWLTPRDTTEIKAWKAAYTLARSNLYAYPDLYPDVWIAASLRGDTVALPDTLPEDLWKKGWPFHAVGTWLYNEAVTEDTFSSLQVLSPPDTLPPPSPPDFFWEGKGSLPVAEWAASMQLYHDRFPEAFFELIGYYRQTRSRNRRWKELHELRRTFINRYKIPAFLLRVTLQKAGPDFPEKAIRLRCYGP